MLAFRSMLLTVSAAAFLAISFLHSVPVRGG